MIEFIEVIKPELKDREIFIWDIGRAAMWVFYCAAVRGVNVQGFVTNLTSFCGETLLNRPIVSPETFQQNKNAVLLMSDEVEAEKENFVNQFGECYRWQDVLEWNPLLYNTSAYVYGCDDNTWQFIKKLDEKGVKVESFIANTKTFPQSILGAPVRDLSHLTMGKIDRVIIPKYDRFCDMAMMDCLQSAGFDKTIFLSEITPKSDAWSLELWTMLDHAVKNNKQIHFCCEDKMGRGLFHRVLAMYDVPISREVSYEGSAMGKKDDIWSLADEDVEQSVLLIHAFSLTKRYKIAEAANDLGYSLEKHNYAGTSNILYNKATALSLINYERDEKLFYSLNYSAVGGLPGWAVYGEESESELRIMTLGGSTSSEVFYPENWISKLYKKITRVGKHVVIYNGAHPGNAVFHELNRLTRDIRRLKPDIVISLSGYNDMACSNSMFEVLENENLFERWRRMESYMKLIAETEGARYYAFLQPTNSSPENQDLYEFLRYHVQSHYDSKLFADSRKNNDFYYDLFTLFQHRSEMLIDMCHYSETGHEELAKKIYSVIEGSL